MGENEKCINVGRIEGEERKEVAEGTKVRGYK